MRFKLHTVDLSPFGQRAKLALRVKGLIEETQINTTFGGTDELGALAPMRQIPILEHKGFILPESQAIVEYLEDIAPTPTLLPATPEGRGQAHLLARMTDLYIAPHFLTLIVGMRPPPCPQDMAEAFESLNKGLGFIEHYLASDTHYAVGEHLSLADLAMAPFFFYIPHLADWHGQAAFPQHPKCAAYLKAIAKAPHIDKAFTEMETAYKARIDMLKR